MASTERNRPGQRQAPVTRRAPDRRDLLKLAAALPLVPLLASCGDGPERPDAGEPILVVGGGLAGLRALDRLVSAGHEAVVLEASARLGGRVCTLREEAGFARGLRAEAGAERVGAHQRRLQELLAVLGLQTEPYPAREGPVVLHWEGRRHAMRRREDVDPELLRALKPAERDGFPDQIHVVLATAGAAPAVDDPRSGLAWLRDLGLSTLGEALIQAFCPYPVARMPAAALRVVADREAEMLAGGGGATIRGGSDLVIHRLAERHTARIRKGLRVVAAEEDASGVLLTTEDSGQRRVIHRGRAAIFCLPAPALVTIDFPGTGGMPPELARRIDALLQIDELKVHLQVPAALFADGELSDYTLRRHFPRVTWRLPEESRSGEIVLNLMALREDLPLVRASLEAKPPEIAALVRERLPAVARAASRVRCRDLAFDPLIRPFGGWAFAVARSTEGRQGKPVRTGRLVFAGSDLSPEPGWMEGALASADAAALEVLQ